VVMQYPKSNLAALTSPFSAIFKSPLAISRMSLLVPPLWASNSPNKLSDLLNRRRLGAPDIIPASPTALPQIPLQLGRGLPQVPLGDDVVAVSRRPD
jgi:hypothetical protein